MNGLVVNVCNVGEDQSVIFKISDKGTLELAAAVVEAPPRVYFENIGVDARVLQKQMEPPSRGSCAGNTARLLAQKNASITNLGSLHSSCDPVSLSCIAGREGIPGPLSNIGV